MGSASNFLGSIQLDLPTGEMNTTLVIGLAYIFLAYGVHPATECAYLRVRAYRAWRRIEEGETVDVTKYPTWMELFGGCGRRDTARVVSLLLLLFALASWILELSIGVFPVPNPAYSQTLPPPVFKWSTSNSTQTSWHVLSLTEIDQEYEGDWWNLPNVFATKAKSRYFVEEYKNYVWSTPKYRYIDGDITVASWPPNDKQHSNWSPDDKPDLVYGKSDTVAVDGITCSSGGQAVNFTDDPIPVTLKNETNAIEIWGTVLECDQGPARIDIIGNSKPSIILTERETGDTHVIVEETSSEPSFLHSVWNATGASISAAGNSSVEIAYAFHIESKVRLAEAVITAIVNGVADEGGGACFGLLRAYKKGPHHTVDVSDTHDKERATPFGEDPVSHRISSLKDKERIITGIEMNTNAIVALALIMGLSFIGIALALFLCPKYEMDIYNRDELLRAINLQAQGLRDNPSRHSAMHIEPLTPAMVLTASPVPSNPGSRVVSPTHPTAEGSSASAAPTPTFLSEPGRGASRFPDASLLFRSSSSDVEGRIGYADYNEEEGDADVEMGM